MKFILIIYLSCCAPVFGQKLTKTIKTNYSKKEAIIFSYDYKEIILISKDLRQFTPNMTDIIQIEKTLCDSLKGFNRNYRQYAGYFDDSKNRIVIVNILSKKVIRSNPEWKNRFILGAGEFWEKNQKILYYNTVKTKFINP